MTEAELRPRFVGTPVARVEDPRLLAGRGAFAEDGTPPRCAHLAFRRSDHPHARIVSIGTDAARAAPGVIGVFDAADLDGTVRPLRATSRMKDYHATAIFPLARDRVRYVGEPVVAVLAASRYAAEDAAELLDIAYEALPVATDAATAATPDAPLLHPEAGTNVLLARGFARGEVDAAFAAAAVVVSGRFRMGRKAPAALENRAALAEWDHAAGALTLRAATGIPGVLRDALAEALDLPGSRVRVIAGDVGGSFGGKGSLYAEELTVAALARKLGRAVKWSGDRLEDLLATSQAFDETIEAELALAADGAMLGLRAEVLGDIGAVSIFPWTASLEPVQVISFLPGPYRIPAYAARVRGVATPKPPTGPYRGVGRPAATFAMERLVDLAAARLGIDPAELRRRNLVAAGEFPYRTGSGLIWDRAGFRESLDTACADGGYAALRSAQAEARAAGRCFGIGLATYAELTGIGSRIAVAPGMPINTGTETASVRIDPTGAVTAAFGIAAHGQGLETALGQVVADALGARFADVRVLQGDSALVPSSTGTYASRSAVIAGGAARLAGAEVKRKLLRAAALLLEAAETDLEAEDGIVRVAGTDRAMTFREIARAVYSEMGRIPRERREDLAASETYDPYLGTASCATHLAAVEVDPETFAVTIRAYHVAEDCGRMINPAIVEGQVQGGVAQGIGAALLEDMVYDATGQNLSASFVDYLLPTASEIPALGITHLELPPPDNLLGVRGMGEGGTIGAPAAIANAVADALGVAVETLPLTPDRLFHLIHPGETA
ncbi:MAG: xanthine dehydrogenase family protein [Rhodospirillales bacterium]|nr:xanthine dehydrogenase family protein [Rhodospirillales bacterium]